VQEECVNRGTRKRTSITVLPTGALLDFAGTAAPMRLATDDDGCLCHISWPLDGIGQDLVKVPSDSLSVVPSQACMNHGTISNDPRDLEASVTRT
jgi:hypothetical protein